MKIGLLTIEIYGDLLFKTSIEHFISSMDRILKTISEDYEFDYRRFAFFSAVIEYSVPLKIYWKLDTLYKTLIRNLNFSFDNWEFDITLVIHERGE